MSIKTLEQAFHEQLRDILHAEKQLVKALPKMEKAATDKLLKTAFRNHLDETVEHVARIEQAFEDLDKPAKAKKCKAMEGLLAEASECLAEETAPEVLDALLIACAQKVEHYEIATYGTLCTWAKLLDMKQALALLKKNKDEEEAADRKLTELSSKINMVANV